MGKSSQQKLTRAFAGLIGCAIDSVEYPGGKSRKSFRLHLNDGRSVIATKRKSSDRAMLEGQVMKRLSAAGAPVPEVVAFNGLMLVQEDVGDFRLSAALQNQSDPEIEDKLDQALASLTDIHLKAHAAGLDSKGPIIGNELSWLRAFVDRPFVLGEFLDIPEPKLDREALARRLHISDPKFVKWDARPGNALIHADNKVVWFDWEHCGRRAQLDDLAWLLGDEFVPNRPEIEDRLLAKHIATVKGDRDLADARDYFYSFGALHSLVRLGLILQNKGDGDWWDFDYCLKGDKVGITRRCARRICQRGQRWAAKSKLAAPLEQWFSVAEDRVNAMRR